MYNISGAVTDVMRRVIYPFFASAWSLVRNLTGRQRRLRRTADGRDKAAATRRNIDRWNESHGR